MHAVMVANFVQGANAVSEPAVLLASLIPEDLPKRERASERERKRYPFKEMTIG